MDVFIVKRFFLILLAAKSIEAYLNCLGTQCDAYHPVCKLMFEAGYIVDSHCDRDHGNHAHGHIVCTTFPPSDDHCHCVDQKCINRAMAFTTTTTTTTTTPLPTNAPTTTPLPTNAPTTTPPTTKAPIVPIVTAMPTTTTVVQHSGLCVDRDAKCAESFYKNVLCLSNELNQLTENINTCPLTCNLCKEYYALHGITTSTAALTQPPTTATVQNPGLCLDRDAKCADPFYKFAECNDLNKLTENIQKCPVTCNLCKEYYALYGISPPPTTTAMPTAPPTTAIICADSIAKCSEQVYQSIICNSVNPDTKAYAIKTCPKSCNLCKEHHDSMLASGFGK